MSRWDLAVIGAGVVGVFHAYWAARAGMRVLLIERNDWPRHASARNFGMVIPSGMVAGPWHERALASVAVYEELVAAVGLPGVRRGMTYLAATDREAAVLAEFARIGPDHGYRCELLTPEAARVANPAIRPVACHAALSFPDDLLLDPPGFFQRMILWLTGQFAVDYRPRTLVTAVERAPDGCIVRLAGGEAVNAARAIICPGAESATLFPEVFARAGVSFTRLQMMRTVPQAAVLSTGIGTGWTIRRYDSFALAPLYEQLRQEPLPESIARFGIHVLMKQDNSGAVTIGDSHQTPPDEGALRPELDMAIDNAILDHAQAMIDLPTWQIAARWSGAYPTHPTESLLREQIDDRITLVVILDGKGMTCAPAVARETVDALA